MKYHTADFIRVTSKATVSHRELERSFRPLEIVIEQMANELAIKVHAFIACMPQERIVIDREWPADWWQAFRERWFPQWWLIRHPIRHERVYINQRIYSNICPHIQKDNKSMHLDFLASRRPGPGGVINGEVS